MAYQFKGFHMTLVVTGGQILSPNSSRGESRDIVIEGDTIADLVPPGSVRDGNIERLDATRRLVIPGLINSHTHSHGGLSKGIGDRWSLEILQTANPWLGGNRGIEDKYLSALITAIDQVEKGTTACYDLFFEFPTPSIEGMEAVASAYNAVGLRAVIAPMVADLTFYQSLPGFIEALEAVDAHWAGAMRMGGADQVIEALHRIAAQWRHPGDRLRLGIAPTIPHHCTKEFMIACRNVARENGLVMQTHVGEAKYQAASSFAIFGMSMTQSMNSVGIVGPWFSAAHAVWLDDADMRLLAERGAQVAHNPSANLRLGSGISPARDYLRHGVTVGIGTDGCHCSDNQNMFEAMRAASFVSRVRGLPPQEWLSTDETFSMATEGSARVLGFHNLIGKVAKGYKADLVLLDLDHVNFMPLNNAVNQIVHAEDGCGVDKVLIGGRLVVSGGRVIGIDKAALAAKADAAVERLHSLNAEARRLAGLIEPIVVNFCHGLTDSAALAGLHRLLPRH
jgi:5-methylthioadenosine/S-adenosylhomocysteine deaminase